MQMHWSAASRQPAPHLSAVVSSATSSFDRPAQPPMQGRSPDMTGLVDDDARHHLGPPTTAAVGGTNPPTPIPSTPHNNNATTTQTSTNTNTSIPQANTSRRVPPKQSHHHPPPPAMAPRVVQPSSGSCTQSSAGHSAFYHTDGGAGMNQRDAPPALAGAQHQRNAGAGTYFSGTRTTFTDVPTASMYSYSTSGGGTGGGGGANNNTAPVSGLGVDDFSDEEINQLLHELECSVGSPYAQEVLRDAAAAIEERATLNFDPLARDVFLEQRIRSVLNELIRVRSTASLQLACQLIDAVLDIPYTSAPHKFTRLCRSLTVVLQSGQMEVAMEAQRVYKRMLDVDRHFHAPEPPLKLFIAKELKDTCELALLQLHGRIQQVNAPFTAQYLSIMLLSASTAEVSPRYMSMHLRGQVVQLATILVGSDDAELRRAAYDCLVAIFSSTHHLQHNEIVMENRRVWDECLRTLNTSQSSEAGLVSSLKVLRALLSSRGLQCIDKQVLPPLCILVTEQQRVSRSSAIREAVFDLVPIIASFDIASAPRRLTYVAIIMEPVKNVRAEQSKREELLNVAAFIRSVGYSALDPTNRINLDSILHRYISRPETQEACWCILAAMCESIAKQRNTSGALLTSPKPARPRHGSSGSTLDNIPITTSTDLNRSDATASVKAASNNSVEGDDDAASRSPTSSRSSHALLGSGSPHRSSTSAFLAGGSQTSVEDVVRRCLPHLTSAALTSQLVKHLAIIQQCVAPLKDEVQQALEQLVNIAMKEPDGRTNANPTRTTATGPPRAADTHGLVMPDARSDDRERTSSSTTGMMAPSPSVSVDGSSARLTQLYKPVDGNPIGTAPNNNNATRAYSPTTPSNPSGSGSATLHYSPSSMEEHHFPVSDLTVALEVFSRRPVNSLQQLEELKNAVVPFMRHSEVAVRKQCSATIMTCLTQWIRYAMEHRTSTYSTRVTEILEAFVKHALAEQDPSCRLECITLLATTASIRSFLLEQRILSPLLSFLNGAPKIRERTVELLVAITQDPSPTATVVSVQQSLTITIESCVTVLEYAVDVRSLIRCVADLQTFTQLCVRPLGSHLGRIFLAFQKKLRDPSVADVVSLAILKTLERILTALAKDERSMLSHHDDVVDIYGAVVAILRDSSSPSLRHAAIDVLVCAHRLYSYPSDRSAEQHQELIAAVTSVYTGTTYTRLELFNMLSLFGQLGAIDPTIQSSSNNLSAAKKAAEDATAQAEADLEMAHDYTVIVYRTLCRMLDVTLSDAVCLEALRALLQFMHFCGEKRSLVGGVHAVRAVVKVAKRTAESPSLRIEALRILSAIITMRHERVARVVLPEIVVLLEQLWIPTDLALFRALLEVVAALKPGKLSAKEQSESWAWLYPRLMDVALQDRTETNEFCLRVVEIILSASYIPPHCVPLVLPMLIQFVQKSEQLIEVRSQSLCAAIHIVCELNAGQYFPLLMHGIRTLTRHCELKEDLGPRLATPGVRESLKLLASLYPGGRIMIKALRDRFMEPEVMPLSAATSPSAILGAFRSSRAGTTGRVSVPSTYRTNSYSGAEDEEDGLSSHPPQHMEGTSYDLSVFIKHIDWGLRLKESKLREWFGELQKCIILASPSPAFRMTIDLFDKHEPLRRELFHPSFKSLYEVLPVEQIRKVNEVLANVLASNDSELVSRCLGLSDYLDHNPPNFQPGVVEELTAMKRSDPMLGISNNNNSSVDSGQYRGVLTSHALRSLSGSDGFDILRRSREIKGSASISTTATGAMVVPAGSAEEAHNALTFQDSLDNEEGARGGGGGGGGGIRPRAGPHTTLVPGRLRPPHQPHSSSGDASAKGGSYEARSEGEAARLASHIPLTPHVLFSSELITKAAERTHMYDKAVSTLENTLLMLLRTCRTGTISKEAIRKIVWPLARLYSKREMQDSVVGLFQAIRYKGESNDGFGFELLQWWEEAQKAYSRSVMHADAHFSTASSGLLEGYIRTLVFCGEFSRATEVAKRVCYLNAEKATSSIARCGAMAAWVLGSWEDVSRLAECIGTVEQHSFPQRLFFSTGMHLRSAIRDKSAAISDSLKISLTQAKLAVDDSLRTLLPLSYAHAYENLTMLQHFTEMEELLEYTHCHSEALKHKMRESWNFRFMSLKPDAFEPSMRSLLLHSLVLTTQEMSDMILHFCDSMGSNYPRVTHWAMEWLKQGVVPPQVMAQSPTAAHAAAAASTTGAAAASSSSSPTTTSATSSPSSIHCASITVGFFAHIWNQGRRQEAVAEMERFLEQYGAELETSQVTCYGSAQLKLGTWKQELHADSFWKKELREEALSHFHKAIRSVPSSYEAWHSWGLINYRVQQRDRTLSLEEQRSFVEAAHQGFVAAICRCKDSSEALPGVMRLLQLWVIHNGVSLLKETVADSISRIPVDHWVQAIPQLIGHLGSENHDVREVIGMILISICSVHPQAVVFPLLVVYVDEADGVGSSDALQRRKRELAQAIVTHCPKRIRHEAETVANLLMEVSAIPIERIREHLSQVAAAWNPNAEFEEDKEEVHRRLKAAMELFNNNRRHFIFTVGNIGDCVKMVMEDERRGNHAQAVRIVNQLVDEISKHIAKNLGREPQKAMEPLLRLRNLSVAVFGKYDIHSQEPFPTIASFSSKLDVIPSKKRPRRIQLNGSDGCLYSFCLKGNEDIRMDERVMQLFGMVNVLLSHSRGSSAAAYIHRFPVIPISPNMGLLGWVENASTINSTICYYRSTISKVSAHHESQVLTTYLNTTAHWEKLSLVQRTEVLEYVMGCANCEAVDVSRAMWHRANTAEQWLASRTAFTTSLASMSMVGYVMGLGDRHLGNLLLSTSTGKIIHIDFGDSFDVGRLRHVLPETIPFRLTRMLTNAMEVFGVDGVFRASATRTQTLLHRNRDSIMALLSAFVHDPIVQHKGKMKNMMEKSRSPQDVVERIRNKLRGTEIAVSDTNFAVFNTTRESCRRPDLLYMSKAFDDDAQREQSLAMSPAAQVHYLIEEATRVENYSTMYFGWGPLW